MERCGAVIPTLGTSPWLAECLASLRAQAGAALEIVVVHQGPAAPPSPGAQNVRVVALPTAIGFAAAVNLGLAVCDAPWAIVLNDDCLLEPGWLAALLEALAGAPRLAAVQGANLRLASPERLDGTGLEWNRWWQAVQRGDGALAAAAGEAAAEVLGVSATAAVYRLSALREVARADGSWFDRRLVTFYEDVDLAVRLRAAGWSAGCVAAARARHAGGATTAQRRFARARLLYGNRLLVLARALGRSLPRVLPRALVRDARDLLRAAPHGSDAAGILAGWARAARLLPRFAHRAPPLVPLAELRRFRVGC